MNLRFDWSRCSFLATLGTALGGLFAPAELNAAGIFGESPNRLASEENNDPVLCTGKKIRGCPIQAWFWLEWATLLHQ